MKPRFYWAACAVLLVACSPEPAAEKTVSAASQAASASAAMLTVPTARGDAVVPKNPERVAVYDWAALDTLTELGVNVGATTAPVRVDYLQPAFDKAATVGTLFEPDYEALHCYNPQLVITGGPGAEAYEQLAKKATTIDLTVDNGNIRTSGEKQMETLARIFGKEARAGAVGYGQQGVRLRHAIAVGKLDTRRHRPAARGRIFTQRGARAARFLRIHQREKPRLDFHHRPYRRHRAGRAGGYGSVG